MKYNLGKELFLMGRRQELCDQLWHSFERLPIAWALDDAMNLHSTIYLLKWTVQRSLFVQGKSHEV